VPHRVGSARRGRHGHRLLTGPRPRRLAQAPAPPSPGHLPRRHQQLAAGAPTQASSQALAAQQQHGAAARAQAPPQAPPAGAAAAGTASKGQLPRQARRGRKGSIQYERTPQTVAAAVWQDLVLVMLVFLFQYECRYQPGQYLPGDVPFLLGPESFGAEGPWQGFTPGTMFQASDGDWHAESQWDQPQVSACEPQPIPAFQSGFFTIRFQFKKSRSFCVPFFLSVSSVGGDCWAGYGKH
jgi:hypothetical protein